MSLGGERKRIRKPPPHCPRLFFHLAHVGSTSLETSQLQCPLLDRQAREKAICFHAHSLLRHVPATAAQTWGASAWRLTWRPRSPGQSLGWGPWTGAAGGKGAWQQGSQSCSSRQPGPRPASLWHCKMQSRLKGNCSLMDFQNRKTHSNGSDVFLGAGGSWPRARGGLALAPSLPFQGDSDKLESIWQRTGCSGNGRCDRWLGDELSASAERGGQSCWAGRRGQTAEGCSEQPPGRLP